MNKSGYYVASSLKDTPRKLRCDIPGMCRSFSLCLSHHYGLLLTTDTGFYQVEMKIP